MILVTGGTGFVGQALTRHLSEAGYPIRILIRPSSRSPNLPRGVPVDVAVSSLGDERGLMAAMVGVEVVYHLASAERRGVRASLMDIDIQGTRMVVQAAAQAGVRRLFFTSHLGADRASAYPLLKAKAIAEEFVRRSGIDFTILRSAIAFGPGDSLTSGLARLATSFPFPLLMPGDGKVLLQPFWIEDLATCLVWALEDSGTRNQMYELGGPEYLSFREIAGLVMQAGGFRRRVMHVPAPYLRQLTILLESILPGLPTTIYWLDYLAVNRTCSLDTAPRLFNLLPSRMASRLEYMKSEQWRASLPGGLFRRR